VSNIPGGRTLATVVTDASGVIWFFGGYGLGSINSYGTMNDLWSFDPAAGVWSWLSGSDRPGASAVQGTLGVPDPANHPGPREGASAWADGAGNIWIFGGTTPANTFYVNDLWRFNPTTQVWTWMNGTDPTSGFLGVGLYDPPGTTNGNVPSSRSFATAWTDATGNFWLFGGDAVSEDVVMAPQTHNDLWKYMPATNTWLWLSGSDAASPPAVFGTQGAASMSNVPSGREYAASWIDANGKLWLWGGSTATNTNLSDVWSVAPQ
jgi:N-acetylneuraminic acid mutarotase